MNEPLYTLTAEPKLDSPMLVMHLRGWIDAGSAAAMALDSVKGQLEPLSQVARFDDDRLIDYRSRRPTMKLVDGMIDELQWPRIELSAGRFEGRDFLVLHGAEPDRHWRTFAAAVIDLAKRFGASKVLGFGAFPSPTPHTRDTDVVCTSTNTELVEAIGHNNTRMEVPTGINAAIEQEAGDRALPAATMWAAVPHYVSTMDYPAGAAALVERLASVTDSGFDSSRLTKAAESTRSHIDELVAADPQHREMLAALESHADEQAANRQAAVPSGDELAFEIEAFLRDPDSPT
ncbi:MAG: PAC2 family protein [Actinomycetia bacterium]|nr:PAC2 family protein [Actinomycetes bacterium]MCP4959268.1 PAC2 family protein [Actinomycetes bacterium]